MKDEREIKRLIRLLAISWALLLFFVLVLAWWISAQLVSLKSKVMDMPQSSQVFSPAPGVDGKDGQSIQGEQGIKGDKGRDGTDGSDSISQNTIVHEKETIVKEVPIQGEKGEQGLPGKDAQEIQLSKDKTGNIIWKYENDDTWNKIEEVE